MTTEIHALVGAYALDAVNDIERADFDRHLSDCADCAGEVTELRETAARLADGTWSVPPPRLREEVLARVGRTPQERPASRRTPRPARALRRWTVGLAAAAALLAAAGTGTYIIQDQRVRQERSVATDARAEAAWVAKVLAAPDARLRSGTISRGGRVSVVVSESQDSGLVLLADVASPGADRAYQLWLVEGTTPRSAGVLAAGETGGTRLIEGVRGMDLLAVTVEPAGGSATPSRPAVAAVPLA